MTQFLSTTVSVFTYTVVVQKKEEKNDKSFKSFVYQEIFVIKGRYLNKFLKFNLTSVLPLKLNANFSNNFDLLESHSFKYVLMCGWVSLSCQ